MQFLNVTHTYKTENVSEIYQIHFRREGGRLSPTVHCVYRQR